MTIEQEGAPSASAGGAPAPDLRALCAAALPALDATRKVFEAAAAPLPPFKRRPVLGDPNLNMTGDEDGNTWPEGVGWALSGGCQLTFGSDEKAGVPYVQVSLSDEDRRRGITQRTATRAQVAEFAQLLTAQFGPHWTPDAENVPDPRDAETERLRGELHRIRDIALVVLNVLPDDDDRSAVDLVREILQNAGPEKLRRDNQFRDLVAERDRKRRELADVAADRDRWQAHYGQLIGSALAVQQHLQRATDRLIHPSDQFDKDFSRSVVDELKADLDGERQLRAEIACERDNARQGRDRLRQELDLIGEQVPKFRDGQRVRIGRHFGTVEKPRAVTRVRLDGMAPAALFETRFVHAIEDVPAKPRRWVAGDPEPEVGTTVRMPDVPAEKCSWSRHANGVWHKNGSPTGGTCWAVILQHRGELIEVVSTDG